MDTVVPEEMAGNTIVVTHPTGKTHGYEILNVSTADGQSTIELKGMDPGFKINRDGTSELEFYPFTQWTGETTFQIENAVQADIDNGDQEEVNAASIIELIAELESEGALANENAARVLMLHMTAMKHFEDQGEQDKVAEHMEGFRLLLDQQRNQELITEEAYQALKAAANALTA